MYLIQASILVAAAMLFGVLGPSAEAAAPVGRAADATTGERPARRGDAGRTRYIAPRDFADTGSLRDALASLPFVEVDMAGGITLNGDPNVAILIDGRPSIELSGEWRVLALQQTPASSVEAIEIMANTVAAFQADSARNVINIITKKTMKPRSPR